VTSPDDRWYDSAAGPIVRPYAMTRGRTRPRGEPLDLISVVVAADPALTHGYGIDRYGLDPEHLDVLALCSRPVPVADLASEIDLPLGIVRVLLDDLRGKGLIEVRQPAQSAARTPDEGVLRQVLDGLRAL
jgi:DNA-binding transcriptional ArsR family regulator